MDSYVCSNCKRIVRKRLKREEKEEREKQKPPPKPRGRPAFITDRKEAKKRYNQTFYAKKKAQLREAAEAAAADKICSIGINTDSSFSETLA